MTQIIHDDRVAGATRHAVLGASIFPPFADGLHTAIFALGCFWGAERAFWQLPGVQTTAVGYAGGETCAPTYKQICAGDTGHAEAVLVVFDEDKISYDELLKVFWQTHDPTQGNRQGNDVGSQYRSVIFAKPTQFKPATQSKDNYQVQLSNNGFGGITTEVIRGAKFYYAEDEHQQYLAKHPNGYCGLGGTGIKFI